MQDVNKVGNLLKKCALPESSYGIFVNAVGFARDSFVVRSRVGARLELRSKQSLPPVHSA